MTVSAQPQSTTSTDTAGDAPRFGYAKAVGIAAAGSIVANAVIAWIAVTVFGASATFMPLTAPVFIMWSVLGVAIGALGWRIITRRAQRPARVMRWLVPTVLVLSFIPDFFLLTPDAMPGATTAGVLALMVMHVAVAAIAVPAYQRFMPARDTVQN
jgi:hypothetical protein